MHSLRPETTHLLGVNKLGVSPICQTHDFSNKLHSVLGLVGILGECSQSNLVIGEGAVLAFKTALLADGW